jgi:hypothetical protein
VARIKPCASLSGGLVVTVGRRRSPAWGGDQDRNSGPAGTRAPRPKPSHSIACCGVCDLCLCVRMCVCAYVEYLSQWFPAGSEARREPGTSGRLGSPPGTRNVWQAPESLTQIDPAAPAPASCCVPVTLSTAAPPSSRFRASLLLLPPPARSCTLLPFRQAPAGTDPTPFLRLAMSTVIVRAMSCVTPPSPRATSPPTRLISPPRVIPALF